MTHTGEWREGHAAALDFEAAEIGKALAELDNVHAILETRGRDALCSEVRQLASALRAEQAAMTNEARTLRSEPPAAVLPITSRFPR